jgi:hypothetical protein
MLILLLAVHKHGVRFSCLPNRGFRESESANRPLFAWPLPTAGRPDAGLRVKSTLIAYSDPLSHPWLSWPGIHARPDSPSNRVTRPHTPRQAGHPPSGPLPRAAPPNPPAYPLPAIRNRDPIAKSLLGGAQPGEGPPSRHPCRTGGMPALAGGVGGSANRIGRTSRPGPGLKAR